MGRWKIPDDWIEEEDGYKTVLFCFPNSVKWRGLITAHLHDLAYGRFWDETTGSILDVLDLTREVLASMAICDLQTELDRIATAVELMADNQPKLYTLAELEEVFVTDPTIDWEQVEAFLDVFGLLPGIKFDPLKYILEWIYRAQDLSNSYAQSTAQTAMASALAKGLAIDGIEGILETVDDAGDFLTQILIGGGTVASALAAIATLFKDTEEGSSVKMLQDVIVNLADVTVTVENTVECGSCGGGGCSNCRQGGVAFNPLGLSPPACAPPVGFGTWPIYTDYKCRAVNRIYDDFLSVTQELALTFQWFNTDLRSSGPYLSTIQTLNRIGNFLPDAMPNPIEVTFTPSDIATLKEEMNKRYGNFHQQNINDDWLLLSENKRIFYGVYDDFADVVIADKNTLIQGMFDEFEQADLFATLNQYISDEIDAIAIADPTLAWTDDAKASLQSMLSTGFTNMPFFNSSFAMNYSPSFSCVGQMGCCVLIWQTVGVFDGELYQSEFTGSHHEIAMWFESDDPSFGSDCMPYKMPRSSIVNGFTHLGTGDSVQLFETAVLLSWEADAVILDTTPGAFCGFFYRLRSTTAFSIDIDTLAEECF